MADRSVRLFSYGTLQRAEVQRATFGRLIEGEPDSLPGYVLMPLAITDSDVVALSGLSVHQIACRTGREKDRIHGLVFAITADELEACDRYEVDAYARCEVVLASGTRAFAYVGQDAA